MGQFVCVCVWCISVCIYERVNVCVCAFILPCSYPDMFAAFNFLAKCTLTSFIDYVMVLKIFFFQIDGCYDVNLLAYT